MNDFRVENLGSGNVFAHCLSGYRQTIKMQHAEFGYFVHHGADAAGFIELFDVVVARRCEVTKIRRLLADFVGNRQIKIDTTFMRDGRQMQHGVGGAPQSHVDGQSV